MSNNATRAFFHKGDTRPYLRAVLSRMDPLTHQLSPINLTGVVGVNFRLYRDEKLDLAPKAEGACVVVGNPVNGVVEFAPGATTFDEAGQFWGAFDIDWTPSERETLPDMGYFSVLVHEKGVAGP